MFHKLMGLSTALIWSISCILHASVNRVTGPVGLIILRFPVSIFWVDSAVYLTDVSTARLFPALAAHFRLPVLYDLRVFFLQRHRSHRHRHSQPGRSLCSYEHWPCHISHPKENVKGIIYAFLAALAAGTGMFLVKFAYQYEADPLYSAFVRIMSFTRFYCFPG